jgi:hypothetical protein
MANLTDTRVHGNLQVSGTVNVTGAISGASVNTGFGANQVYKTSTQTITAHSNTAQLSAMDIGEVRYVYYSCDPMSAIAYLKTPAGGNFYISPIPTASDTRFRYGGSYAGNTTFASFGNDATGVFIIRRNS